MDGNDGYDSDGDLVLSLVPGLAEGLSAAAAEAEADRNRRAAACQPPVAAAAAAAAATAAETHDRQQHSSHPDLHQPAPAPAQLRPLSPYNMPAAPGPSAAGAAAARAAPAPAAPVVAPNNSTSSSSSSFALPSSAKVALEELRVSLDPRLVTHPTGHAMLPALAAAGIRARVGAGAGGGKSGAEQHSLLRWRTVLFFRRRKRGAGPRRRATARRGTAASQEASYGDEDETGEEDANEAGDGFDEEQVPFVLACLTAADVVRAVDRAAEEESRRGGAERRTDFDPGAGLERLVRDAASAHPGCTLGVVVEGLEAHCISRERADAASRSSSSSSAAAAPCFVARRYDARLLAASAAVRHPALRLALLPDAAAAADYLVGLARALAEQPLRASAAAAASCGGGSRGGTGFSSSQQQQLLRTHGGGRRGDTQAAREALLLLEAGSAAGGGANGNGGGQQLPAASVALARALARIPGVGPAAAIAVASEHGSFGALMRFVEGGGGSAGGAAGAAGGGRWAAAGAGPAALLAELRTSARGAAAGSGPRVGPAAARRVVAMLRAVDGGAAADW